MAPEDLASLCTAETDHAAYLAGWRAGYYSKRVAEGALGLPTAPGAPARTAPIGGPSSASRETRIPCLPRNARAAGASGGPPPIYCEDDRPPEDYEVGQRERAIQDRIRAQDDAVQAIDREILKRRASTAAPATAGEIRLLERQKQAIQRDRALQEIYKPAISP